MKEGVGRKGATERQSGCCNTATYLTGREKRERGRVRCKREKRKI